MLPLLIVLVLIVFLAPMIPQKLVSEEFITGNMNRNMNMNNKTIIDPLFKSGNNTIIDPLFKSGNRTIIDPLFKSAH